MCPSTPPRKLMSLATGVLIGAVSCGVAGNAWSQGFRTYVYTELDGLRSSEVHGLVEDASGALWFACRSGVSRFDGHSWQPVDHPRVMMPLSHLTSGTDGSIYGACSAAGGRIVHWPADGEARALRAAPGDRDTPVLGIATQEVAAGTRVVLGTEGAGLLLFESGEWTCLGEEDGLSSHSVRFLAGRSDELLIGTPLGVDRLSADAKISPVELGALPEGQLFGVGIERMDGPSAALWVLGANWLARVENGRITHLDETLSAFEPPYLNWTQIQPDGIDTVYLAQGDAVWSYRVGSRELRRVGTREGLGAGGANRLLLDNDRNVWFASYRGVTRVPPPRFLNRDNNQGLLGTEVSALLEDPTGRVVLGHTHGLSFLEDGQVETLDFFATDPSTEAHARVNELCSDGQGGIWIAANHVGVGHLDSGNDLRWLPRSGGDAARASSVFVDSRGRVLVGTTSGLSIVEGGRWRQLATPGAPAELPVRRISEWDGHVVIATMSKGLWLEGPGGWAEVRAPSSRGVESAYVFAPADSHGLWVGTKAGLFTFDGEALQRCERPRLEVPVHSIVRDDRGRTWFGTNKGVTRWDGTGLTHYGVREGLAGQDLSRAAALCDSDGRLWFGTDGGVSTYQEAYDLHSSCPAPEISHLNANPPALGPGEEVKLSNDESDLIFTFRSISFIGDARVSYRCLLEGYDTNWVDLEPGTHQARYINLPPGRYQLRAQARNSTSPWSQETRSAEYVVAPPLWRTRTFLFCAALGILSVGAGLSALIGARRRSASLDELVIERTRELERSERRYQEIFRNSPAMLLLVEPEHGRILDANTVACDLLGVPAHEIHTRYLADLIGLEPHKALTLLQRTAASNERETENSFCSLGLKRLELSLAAYELGGRPVVQIILKDVTDNQRREEELRQAQKLRAVGQMAGGIAHDFNNLLTAILGCSEMASAQVDPRSTTAAYLRDIAATVKRGAGLVAQLLAFGRKQLLHPEVVNANEAIERCVGWIERLLGGEIELSLRLAGEEAWIEIDRDQLEQMLFHLVTNAREAMPGGGRLVLETAHGACKDDGDSLEEVRIVLSDTGSGMDGSTLEHIFDPFFSTKAGASGLGLSTVHGIVHQSGGRISVSSQPGEGTSVVVAFPRVASGQRKRLEVAPAREASVAPSAGFDPNQLTLLLVEDNETVRNLSARALRKNGFRLLEASDATSARGFLRSQTIDILLTDIVMPGQSGIELAQWAWQEHPGLPVIFMSGYDDGGLDLDACRGPTEFVRKPYSPRDLGGHVARVLAKRRALSKIS